MLRYSRAVDEPSGLEELMEVAGEISREDVQRGHITIFSETVAAGLAHRGRIEPRGRRIYVSYGCIDKQVRAWNASPMAVLGRCAIVMLLLSFVAIAPTATAGEGAPLRITAAYSATPTPDPLCGGFHVVGTGSASGTVIGKAAWGDDECASLIAQPGSIVINGTLTLTAINGDELVATYTATSALPDANGAIHPEGAFKIIGGTGRFVNASGGGHVTADANIFDPATTARLEGSIVFD